LKHRATEGDSPVRPPLGQGVVLVHPRVGLLESAAQIGRYVPVKAKYHWETDSEQVA